MAVLTILFVESVFMQKVVLKIVSDQSHEQICTKIVIKRENQDMWQKSGEMANNLPLLTECLWMLGKLYWTGSRAFRGL